MSSSSKKLLRKEQVAAKKAQQQQTEAKEQKKVKLYTSIFCVILALMIVLVAVVSVNNSGFIEPRTTAVKVGGTEVSASELNVYYLSAVNEFVQSAGNYLMLYGMDTSVGLSSQVSIDTVNTWDNYFLNSAKEDLHYYYSLYNEAVAAGYTLDEASQGSIDYTMLYMESAAAAKGYTLNENLRNIYGRGVNEDTYRKMLEVMTVANDYYTDYVNGLSFTADDLSAKDAMDPVAFNLYDYSAYVIYASDYLEGGTTDENGNVTYSDDENAASLAAAEAVAKELVAGGYTTNEDLKAAVNALPISAEESISSTMMNQDKVSAASIVANMKGWITDAARQPGDITYVERTVTDADGNTTVSGYNVILFEGMTDNNYPLSNVRHILVNFEGGTADENGNVTYSDDEKAAAKAKAQEIYDAWLAGDATEESFATLANEKSDDTGSNTNGGLYEDIYPGQMVTAFNDWCFAEGRQAGDHGIVETEYGYHVMFYSADSETTYRSYLIEQTLLSESVNTWIEGLLEKNAVEDVNFSRVDRDLVVGSYMYYGYGI